MEEVNAWAKNLIVCLCVLELFCHLVRKEDYRRYIRFFGGLVVLLLVISPFADLLHLKGSFDEALRQALAREEAYELSVSQEALADLQNSQIEKAYRAELERQMQKIAEAHGQRVIKTELEIDKRDGLPAGLIGVRMLLARQNTRLNVFEEDEERLRLQKEAAEAIRAEICAVYGIKMSGITVSVKE